MPTAGGDRYRTTSTSSSTGGITLSPFASDVNHRAFPVEWDGKTIAYLIQNQSISTQFEVGEGVYTHSTRQLTRPPGNVTFGTAGAGANTDFTTEGLIVSNIAKWGLASATSHGLMSLDYAADLDELATSLAYEPVNF